VVGFKRGDQTFVFYDLEGAENIFWISYVEMDEQRVGDMAVISQRPNNRSYILCLCGVDRHEFSSLLMHVLS